MVFVLDKHKKPLMPCCEKRARQLLERKRAVVHKTEPFTIRLKDRTVEKGKLQPLRLKLDPGSKETGVAVINEESGYGKVIFLGEIHHKKGIKSKLYSRRALRRGRRNRKTRYRKARFLNRKRKKGWLPPSLQARVNQTINTVNKLQKLLPLTAISTEHVKFDTQLMQNPEISGIEYQQGTLFGYEIKEYLLEKWNRKCAYCGAENIPLEIEHIIPKSRGGSNRISNLTLSCHDCNQKKDKLTAEEFGYPEIQMKAKKPLKDAVMMNATRWRLFNELKKTDLPVECGTGARTKKQRIEHDLPKTHYYDACCVGASTPEKLIIFPQYISIWTATGRGTRQMCNTDKYGFPKSHRKSQKLHFGFQTGDIAKADIPKGKYQGQYTGRIAVRLSGYFDIKDGQGKRICQGVNYKYCHIIQRNNGWQYEKKLA
ncbi:hnh endonuclease [hydrocarbon metagenome]|uniref:Hnh endonuclease n=1 Tax=hydrocarbon metagenome TaxID=938273 RepID=A0A0W8E9L1_9ZZZZ